MRVIDKINSKIESIITNKDFNEYISKIKPLIEKYSLMGTISKIISFAKNKRDNEDDELPEDSEVQLKRHQLIFNFLEIARNTLTAPPDISAIFSINAFATWV